MDLLRRCTVIYQCGLKRDLDMWDAGDAAEVGEKGVTLRYGPNFVVFIVICLILGVQRRAKGQMLFNVFFGGT